MWTSKLQLSMSVDGCVMSTRNFTYSLAVTHFCFSVWDGIHYLLYNICKIRILAQCRFILFTNKHLLPFTYQY